MIHAKIDISQQSVLTFAKTSATGSKHENH